MEGLEKIQEELLGKVKGLVKEGQGTLKADLEGLVEGIQKATKEEIEGYDKRVSDLEIELKKANKRANEVEFKNSTLEELIAKSVEENLDKIKSVGNAENQVGYKMVVKAPATITSANISGGDIPQARRAAGVNDIPQRPTKILDMMPSMSMTEDKYEWVYLANEDGAAGFTAEGNTKNQIDVDWVVGSVEPKKITATMKVTDEMLAKGSAVTQVINRKLVDKVLQATEAELYDGANFDSLRGLASAFDVNVADDGTATGAIDNANWVDVLATAMTQIEIAQEGAATPNAILMNPKDVLILGKLKSKLSDTDKRYVDRILESALGLTVDGVPVIKSTLVAAGEYLIGDFSKALMVQREGLSIEFGYSGTDFEQNLRTVRAELRANLAIEHNDRSAFVAGVFATDIAALEAIA